MFDLFLAAAMALTQPSYGPEPRDCGTYEAAIAPINSASALCGIALRDGQIVHVDANGETETIGEIPHMPREADQYWVVRLHPSWNQWLVGVRDRESTSMMMINWERETGPYDPGFWNVSQVSCGERGPDHVYGGRHYAMAAYRSEGEITICAMEALYHEVRAFPLINVNYDGPLEALSVRAEYCGDDGGDSSIPYLCFDVTAPDGEELMRYRSPYAWDQ